jgi:hypothetical protein
MFVRFRAVLKLLTGPVPAGFFPVMTLAAAWEEIGAATGRIRGHAPRTLGSAILIVAIMAAISAVAVWLFRGMLRRARLAEDGTCYGLSRAAWTGVLWVGFVAGLACGAVILVQTA